MIGQVAQVDPQVLDNFDTDKFLAEYVDINGVSPDVFRPKRVVDQIRNQRAQQQKIAQQQAIEQQQAQTQNTNANTLQKVSNTDPGNPIRYVLTRRWCMSDLETKAKENKSERDQELNDLRSIFGNCIR